MEFCNFQLPAELSCALFCNVYDGVHHFIARWVGEGNVHMPMRVKSPMTPCGTESGLP